jgi:hypothetical protein
MFLYPNPDGVCYQTLPDQILRTPQDKSRKSNGQHNPISNLADFTASHESDRQYWSSGAYGLLPSYVAKLTFGVHQVLIPSRRQILTWHFPLSTIGSSLSFCSDFFCFGTNPFFQRVLFRTPGALFIYSPESGRKHCQVERGHLRSCHIGSLFLCPRFPGHEQP